MVLRAGGFIELPSDVESDLLTLVQKWTIAPFRYVYTSDSRSEIFVWFRGYAVLERYELYGDYLMAVEAIDRFYCPRRRMVNNELEVCPKCGGTAIALGLVEDKSVWCKPCGSYTGLAVKEAVNENDLFVLEHI